VTAMSKREKTLAAAVGLLLLLAGGYYLFGRIEAGLRKRRGEVAKAEAEIGRMKMVVKQGERAQERIEAYQGRSLPPNRELARSLYQSWLLEQVEKVEFDMPDVKAVSTRRHRSYDCLTFSIKGKGNLRQLVQFLYQFYTADYLHRIWRLRIDPIKETRDFDLTFTIEALILPGAKPRDSLGDSKSNRLAWKELSDYTDVILTRNLFSPANKPPQMAVLANKTVHLNESLSFAVKANDPDRFDTLTYGLGEDAPNGAAISPETGAFRWTPTTLGVYSLTINVTDDGVPAKTASRSMEITVVDPPPSHQQVHVERPKKLGFDDAKYTYVIGFVTDKTGRRHVWLEIRTTGEKKTLGAGDKLTVGSVTGTIRHVGQNDVEIETGNKRLLVSMGQHLGQALELPSGGI